MIQTLPNQLRDLADEIEHGEDRGDMANGCRRIADEMDGGFDAGKAGEMPDPTADELREMAGALGAFHADNTNRMAQRLQVLADRIDRD